MTFIKWSKVDKNNDISTIIMMLVAGKDPTIPGTVNIYIVNLDKKFALELESKINRTQNIALCISNFLTPS